MSRSHITRASFALAGAALAWPAQALAHGLVVRADLPIPEWLFGWAATVVLIISFVALAVLWPKPRLQEDTWTPLTGVVWRVIGSTAVQVLCGVLGALLLLAVIYSGLAGQQIPTANFAPNFVYVIFWVGLVPGSVIFGDVFHAFNPWRAIAQAFAWVAGRLSRGGLPEPLPYPKGLGNWPAAIGIFAFVWLELIADGGSIPRNVALAAIVYTVITFIGMALYGIEPWIARGEAYSVYFNLFSRISPLERRDGQIGRRRILSGLAAFEPMAGTVALLAVMIGSVTFDGFSSGGIWNATLVPALQGLWGVLSLGPAVTLQLTFASGLFICIFLVGGFYRLGILGAKSVGGGKTTHELAWTFVHSLVPIGVAYVMAHYVSLLVVQGQSMLYLISDPLGQGLDLFGTAAIPINYGIVGQATYWYMQVGVVVFGHVAGLMLAHDRALAIYDNPRLAVRSQYWMLAVMIGFTSLALWLLASANQS
ncbi:MAG: hypothetical protein QOG62_1004 [Thermoleophilaceae bacterium]|nr:hypothetical protein [Thermoleophilaceae bacterium]